MIGHACLATKRRRYVLLACLDSIQHYESNRRSNPKVSGSHRAKIALVILVKAVQAAPFFVV